MTSPPFSSPSPPPTKSPFYQSSDSTADLFQLEEMRLDADTPQQRSPIRPGNRELPGAVPLGTTPPTISNFERMIQQRGDGVNVGVSASVSANSSVNRPTVQPTQPTIQPPPQRPISPSPLIQIPVPMKNSSSPDSPILPRPVSRPPSVDWTLRLFNLEEFVFGKTVGTGTFGRVRLVKLRNHDKYFAMKIMRKADIVRLHQVDHIFSEKFLLSRLACPFIIRLYGTFQDQKHLFMLLEYAIGGELFTYLRRAGRFSLGTTKFYAAEIVCALEYMHNLNIVYRDLKPENLLLDARGHIKIADFGFAKVIPDNKTWTLCGTPEYLAPEIILGRGHGRPVDWWALGILIYEMMAGFPPFYDETPFLIYEKILAGKLEFPPHFDAQLCDLLTGLLQPDPQRRLGCGAAGAEDVKSHSWFSGVDWDALVRKQIQAPFIPPVRHAGDTSNFEEYPEEDFNDQSTILNDLTFDRQDINQIFIDF